MILRGGLILAALTALTTLCACMAEAAPATKADFQRRLDAISAKCGIKNKIELRALSATEWTAVFARDFAIFSQSGAAGPGTRHFQCARQQVREIPGRNFVQTDELLSGGGEP